MTLAMLQDWLGKPSKRTNRPRATERFVAIGLSCPLGDVADLSIGGARIRWSKKPALKVGDALSLKLTSESQCVRVQAVVAWIRRTGLMGGGELGFKFVGVSKSMAIALVQLGKYGFVTSDVGTAESAANHAAGRPQTGEAETPPPTATRPSDDKPASAPAPGASSAGSPRVIAAMEVDDLYLVLGVARDASEDAVKAAYRKLALELHPDRNPSHDASVRFTHVSKAYTVLRDPEMRARYDVLLNSSKAA
ncbi:MAG: DnaJ domain-containing protein [Phycisphaerales bacterium]|jgi:hypothetical protein